MQRALEELRRALTGLAKLLPNYTTRCSAFLAYSARCPEFVRSPRFPGRDLLLLLSEIPCTVTIGSLHILHENRIHRQSSLYSDRGDSESSAHCGRWKDLPRFVADGHRGPVQCFDL